MNDPQLLQAVAQVAVAAGEVILEVYNRAGDIAVEVKADQSPLTEADRAAHALIVAQLQRLTPDWPVLSEESRAADYKLRSTWPCYWLVDPLDGTKEFVKRNGEFTVNIALIDNGVARLGVVHVPVTGTTYCGAVGIGATVMRPGSREQAIRASGLKTDVQTLRVVASRSHRDPQLEGILNRLATAFPGLDEVSMGSSLKICLLAEGRADFYPRLAPTSEWDTAAAHAVLAAAGGEIVDTTFAPLRYNQKESLLNPFFLAIADTGYDWQGLLQDALE